MRPRSERLPPSAMLRPVKINLPEAAAAIALAVGLMPVAGAADTPAPPVAAPAATHSSAPAPAPAAAPDAPAKHAKLAACREQAKAKKLLGAQKKVFIANCVAAP